MLKTSLGTTPMLLVLAGRHSGLRLLEDFQINLEVIDKSWPGGRVSALSPLRNWKESLQVGSPPCSSRGLLAPGRAELLHQDHWEQPVLLLPSGPARGSSEHRDKARWPLPERFSTQSAPQPAGKC